MKSPSSAALLLVTGALLLGVAVFADGPPGPSLLLPFAGHLENNNVPLNDPLDVEFQLYTQASGGTEVWSNTRTVDPEVGAFQVVLGEDSALPASLRTANNIYLQVRIDGTDVGGRQKVHAAFQAVTSNGSVDADYALEAGHASTADNATNADYATTAGTTANATGNTTGTFNIAKNGTLSRLTFSAQTNDQGSIEHYESSNTGELWLSSSDDWDSSSTNDRIVFGQRSGGHVRFEVNGAGDTYVHRDLDVNGQLTIGDQDMDNNGYGCERVGSHQTCWFSTTSAGVHSFTQPFAQGTTPAVTCTAVSLGYAVSTHSVNNLQWTGFAQRITDGLALPGIAIFCVAHGRAGSGW